MKIIIYCFSGTGNTLTASRKTAAQLAALGMQTDVCRIVTRDAALYEKALECYAADGTRTIVSPDSVPQALTISEEFGAVPDPNAYDLAGFSYPIHGFNSPQFFLRYVKHLPELTAEKKGMKAFIFKTSGEPFRPNSSSSRTLVHFLKKKGFQPGIDLHMLMPYNIMFRYPDAMAKQMYLHTEVMCRKLAESVADGRFSALHYNPLITLFAYVVRLQWLGAKINGPLHSVKKDLCTGCGLCAKNCPSNNIRLSELTEKSRSDKNGSDKTGTEKAGSADPAHKTKSIPKMGWKCTMCMECTMGCPQGAINPGFLTPWKVNPQWNFAKLLEDDSIASNWTDDPNAGYFRFFRKYYQKTEAYGLPSEDQFPANIRVSDIGDDPWDHIGDEAHDGCCEADADADCRC